MDRERRKHVNLNLKKCLRPVILFGFLLFFTPVPTLNFPATSAGEPLTTAEVLEQIQTKAQTLKSFRAHFEQRKFSRLLLTPMDSEGLLYWQPPGRFRWEVLSPNPLTLVTQGERIMLLYPDLKRATLYRKPLGGGILEQITGATSDPEEFQRKYRLQVAPVVQSGVSEWIKMIMEPSTHRQARYFKRLEVKIDPNTWLPEEVAIQEASKDWTVIHLSNPQENTELPAGLFNVEPPEDFQVQRYQVGGRP